MIDPANIEGFEWDAGNFRKNIEKHGTTQAEAEQVFFNNPLIILSDDKHSADETRFHAFGKTNIGRLLHVSFTLRGNGKTVRVISARDMHRKERDRYAKEA